jgi:hypothetical protein
MDMRVGTWNIRSLYRAGSLVTVPKELSKHRLDFVAPNQEENTEKGMGMGTVNWVEDFLRLRECQQVSGLCC